MTAPVDRSNGFEVTGFGPLIALFDDIPEVIFWIKDRRLRIVALNEGFARWVNREPVEIVGKTDEAFYHPELARVFMADDRAVLAGQREIRGKTELLANRFGGIEWRSTSKLPVRDPRGRVVATCGISRPLADPHGQLPAPYRAFSGIIEYARTHISQGIGVAEIAAHAGMSLSTLARRFREHLGITAAAFLAELRISQARDLIERSPLNLAEIADACGYESPAAFSRAFKQRTGVAPSRYRQEARR